MANTIVTYGGGEIMEGVFHAIAAFLDGGSFLNTTIRLSGTIGVALASMMLIFGDLAAFLKRFFIPFFVILHLLLLPTGKVFIKDLVTKENYAVEGVPIALAVTAGTISSLMDGFTQGVEKVFRLPDDLMYSKTGFLFASRMIIQARNTSIEDPIFNENMKEFVSQCVTYDALIGIKYTLQDLMKTDNVWELVSENASPARSIVYREQKGGRAKICTCQQAVPKLDNCLKSKESLLKHLPVSLNYMLKMSENSQELVRQQLMISAIQSGVASKNNELGNMSTIFALQRAKTQQRTTYQTLGFLAADNLPLMKTILEALTYGIFLFIIPLCLLPLGLRFLSQWFRLVVWVQLWAPLYAILNFMMTISAQRKLSGMGITSLTLGNAQTISDINQDLSVMAGYLSLMIPVMAWGLLNANAQAFTSLASSLGGVASSAANTAASEQSSGNYSFGNITQGSMQIANSSLGQHQTSPTYQSGAFTEGDGDVQMTTSAGGRHFMSQANSNLRSGVNLSESASESFSRMSSDSIATSEGQMIASQQSESDAFRHLVNFGEHQARQESIGESIGKNRNTAYNENANKVFMAAEDFSKTHGLDVSTAAKVLASASVGTPFPIFKASLGAEGTRSAVTQDVYNHAQQFAERNELQDSFSKGVQHLQDHRGSYNDETSQRLAKDVSGSMEEATSLRKESSLSMQNAKQYQTAANWTKQNGYSLNENANQDYIEWLAQKPSHGGRGNLGMQGARTIIANQPDLNRSYQRLFVEERQQGIMNQALQESNLPTSANDVKDHYHQQAASQDWAKPSSAAMDRVIAQGSSLKSAETIQQEMGQLKEDVKDGDFRVNQNLEQRGSAIKHNAATTRNIVESKHNKGLEQIKPHSIHEFPDIQKTKWGADIALRSNIRSNDIKENFPSFQAQHSGNQESKTPSSTLIAESQGGSPGESRIIQQDSGALQIDPTPHHNVSSIRQTNWNNERKPIPHTTSHDIKEHYQRQSMPQNIDASSPAPIERVVTESQGSASRGSRTIQQDSGPSQIDPMPHNNATNARHTQWSNETPVISNTASNDIKEHYQSRAQNIDAHYPAPIEHVVTESQSRSLDQPQLAQKERNQHNVVYELPINSKFELPKSQKTEPKTPIKGSSTMSNNPKKS